MMTNTKKT